MDSAGNLYIADTCNNRIRKVSNGVITTVAGNGTQGFSGDNGPATSAELSGPSGVAVDAAGNLYIADALNNRIRKVSNGMITTVAGSGYYRGAIYGCSNGPAIDAQLGFSTGNGLAVDSAGNLYIPDNGGFCIDRVSNGVITPVAGNGTFGFSGDGGPATSAQLNPVNVAIDAAGNLYIADGENYRIRKVSNGVITTVAGGGAPLGDGGPATGAQLAAAGSVAVDSASNLYIGEGYPLEGGRIRKVSNGVITVVAGNGTWGASGDGGPATSAKLSSALGVAVDYAGDVYVADSYSQRIREVSNGVITTVAGTGAGGFGGDNGPATSAIFNFPVGVAVDSAGNLYIADQSNQRIRKVSNGVITTVAGTGAGGFGGDGGPATGAQLSAPGAVAVDAAGKLYIVDGGRIREVSNGLITTVAGMPYSQDPPGFGGDNGPATSAIFNFPVGVAVDSAGNLYIADQSNQRIRKVSNGVITTIAGNGTSGFSGDSGPATSAQLYSPGGVAVDSVGRVYIADGPRVRVLIPSGASCSASLSQASFTPAAAGGNLGVTIQTSASCAWAVQSLPQWITYGGNAVGTGPATVTLAVAANSGTPRSALISIAGTLVTVSQAGVLSITPGGVVNDANYTAPVAPGSIAAAFGDFLLAAPVTGNSPPLLTNLSGLSLQFGDGVLAPLFYANVGQVNLQVPWELAGQSQTTLTATLNGQVSAAQTVSLATFAPAIFSMNAQGTGQGAILDALSYVLVDSTHPAKAGSTYISIYCTGLGPVTNQPATGAAALSSPLSWTATTPTVTIGGMPATGLEFYGLAPGYAGLYQVNAQVPAASAKGNAVPVTISIGGVTSNTVTIAVQ